jgi:hypothetical protein
VATPVDHEGNPHRPRPSTTLTPPQATSAWMIRAGATADCQCSSGIPIGRVLPELRLASTVVTYAVRRAAYRRLGEPKGYSAIRPEAPTILRSLSSTGQAIGNEADCDTRRPEVTPPAVMGPRFAVHIPGWAVRGITVRLGGLGR